MTRKIFERAFLPALALLVAAPAWGQEPRTHNAPADARAPRAEASAPAAWDTDTSVTSPARDPGRPGAPSAYVPSLADLMAPPASELVQVVERFNADRSVLLRFHDLESAGRRERMREFYRAWIEELDRVPFESLGVEGRIDHLLLRRRLDAEMRRLEMQAAADRQIEELLPFADAIVELHEARRRLEPVDPTAAAETLDRADRLMRETQAAVLAGLEQRARDSRAAADPIRTTPVLARRAAGRVDELRRALDSWFRHFDGYDPLFGWWVRAPYAAVSESLEAYVRVLREDVTGVRPGEDEPIIGDPIGREALLVDLEAEMIAYSPEELFAIAERELAWGEAEMRRAARELGFGDDWRAALEHVKTLSVEPGRQTELVTELAHEAVEFLEHHDLITLEPLVSDVWRMEMLSPEQQRIAPFFLGGETVRVAFPTEDMAHEDKTMSLRANNVHFSRAVVHHELIPGHHLQGFMTSRYSTHRSLFSTPFWGEGWALYWELMLWELGFPQTPEDRIGMLFWRNHRAARIIFSLGFHLGRMTPQECIDLLVERVGHERNSAEGEVRRSFAGSYSPLYQVAYLIGGMQLRELHREAVESGRMTDREFHDHILKAGRMPIEMVRASVLDQELPRNFRPRWRFAEEPASGSP